MTTLRSTIATLRHRSLLAAVLAAVLATSLLVVTGGRPVHAAEPVVYLDEPFTDTPASWASGWYDNTLGPRNRLERISDGADGTGLRVDIPAGSHFGSALRYQFDDFGHDDPDELWFRYYLRFPDGYVNHGRGKLPGFGGLYNTSGRNSIKPTDANPGWSARMFFSPTYTERDDEYSTVGFYVYHRDQGQSAGDTLEWEPVTAEFRHGDWYCVEGHVDMNTPGAKDGVLEGFVDEKLAFHRNDLRFRGSSDGSMGVKSFWFDVYYGGDEEAPGNLSIDFDSLALSSDRIGCGDRDGFRDTGPSVHRGNIDRLAHAGITRGCNPPANDLFCPEDRVTRGQMAAFLTRALSLPASAADHFDDDGESVFEANIDALAESGITKGCGDRAFCPDDVVTRGQMAAFLDRALGLPTTAVDHFGDDDVSIFETSIDRMAAAGITAGCNPPANDRFCPHDYVTREQMASFLSRALGLPKPPSGDEGPDLPDVPAGYDAVVPPGASINATLDSVPEGAKVLLLAGVHPRQEIHPKAHQTIAGEGGTVLDGMGETDYAVVATGADSVDGVTVTGVEITGFVPGNHEGAVHSDGADWTVSDCEIHHIETVGVVLGDRAVIRDCEFHHNHETAILLDGVTGGVIENNEIWASNDLDRSGHHFSGGIEFHRTVDLVIRGNHIHDNHGHGIWTYDANLDALIEDNVIEDNYRAGIFHESSYAAVIRNNTFRNNGTMPGAPGSRYKDAAVLVTGPDVEVYGNTLIDNFNGIVFYQSPDRLPPGPHGPYDVRNGHAHDNVIENSGHHGAGDFGDPDVTSTSSFENNVYRYADTGGEWWTWTDRRDWAAWQADGNDVGGSLDPM